MTYSENQISLLIATDCISEGQNLQDCDYLINYDIHWNPVRIIQRFGRIDRIGSTNAVIQLVNFWPNMELDEYINLESRVTSRMTMLDVSATGEDDLLSTNSKDLEYRKHQLQQLQTEVLDIEDFQDGISITDLTLDDFIMNLEHYLKQNPNLLESYPTGIYAITNIEDKVKNDCSEGVIFCLKQKEYRENEIGSGSLYPYYLVYVSQDGSIHISNKSAKNILDIMKVLCLGKNQPIEKLVKMFNKETRNGLDMDTYTDLIEKAVFDIKGVIEKKGIDSLFTLDAANFLTNSISGLNDFELITFLVVKQ